MTCDKIYSWLLQYDRNFNFKNYYVYRQTNEIIINSHKSINISNHQLNTIPFKFGIIEGNFNCLFNKLTQFKNSPDYVHWNYLAIGNQCNETKGLPLNVGNHIDISFNPIISIKDLVSSFGGKFIHNHNSMQIKELINLYTFNNKTSYNELKLSFNEIFNLIE